MIIVAYQTHLKSGVKECKDEREAISFAKKLVEEQAKLAKAEKKFLSRREENFRFNSFLRVTYAIVKQ